jgi:hypothetical protein
LLKRGRSGKPKRDLSRKGGSEFYPLVLNRYNIKSLKGNRETGILYTYYRKYSKQRSGNHAVRGERCGVVAVS